jgi:hypothetical protein
MYSCHNTAVFIRVAPAARGLQVPTLRRPQDGRKWSAGKSIDMSAHLREEAKNGGFSPQSVLNYLEIWLRRPACHLFTHLDPECRANISPPKIIK